MYVYAEVPDGDISKGPLVDHRNKPPTFVGDATNARLRLREK